MVITHGNGPQVGLLALQGAAYNRASSIPWMCWAPRSEGMIGYMIEQELGNLLPFEQPFATVLTMVEVDRAIPLSGSDQTVGPIYSREEAQRLSREHGWVIAPDNDRYRRVVPSPFPKHIFELKVIEFLVKAGVVVICAGGGGIPTVYRSDGSLIGVEAVIDKDRAGALLARELQADAYLMLTDVKAVYTDWGNRERVPFGAPLPTPWRNSASPRVRWDQKSRLRAISCARPVAWPPSARWRMPPPCCTKRPVRSSRATSMGSNGMRPGFRAKRPRFDVSPRLTRLNCWPAVSESQSTHHEPWGVRVASGRVAHLSLSA